MPVLFAQVAWCALVDPFSSPPSITSFLGSIFEQCATNRFAIRRPWENQVCHKAAHFSCCFCCFWHNDFLSKVSNVQISFCHCRFCLTQWIVLIFRILRCLLNLFFVAFKLPRKVPSAAVDDLDFAFLFCYHDEVLPIFTASVTI